MCLLLFCFPVFCRSSFPESLEVFCQFLATYPGIYRHHGFLLRLSWLPGFHFEWAAKLDLSSDVKHQAVLVHSIRTLVDLFLLSELQVGKLDVIRFDYQLGSRLGQSSGNDVYSPTIQFWVHDQRYIYPLVQKQTRVHLNLGKRLHPPISILNGFWLIIESDECMLKYDLAERKIPEVAC